MRPVIALDVDGVLLPFGQPAVVNPDHGPWLQRLAEHADLVWATSWMHQANTDLAPVLGLPQLPVVDKASVPAYGHPRPLLWVDDMFYGTPCPPDVLDALTGRDTEFFGIDPHIGLQVADYRALMWWITGEWL